MTDLRGNLNADNRKSANKFSCLRWFFVLQDLKHEEASVQANKTNKKH